MYYITHTPPPIPSHPIPPREDKKGKKRDDKREARFEVGYVMDFDSGEKVAHSRFEFIFDFFLLFVVLLSCMHMHTHTHSHS